MTPQESIDATIRRILHVYPIAMQVYRLRVKIAALEDAANTVRQDFPEVAEMVDLMTLISQAALADVLGGRQGPG